MILNTSKQIILCILFCISGITALARVDNWSHKRPNNTVVPNQWGQAGYRPAAGYQQPLPQTQWNRYNQTQGQAYNSNRTQYNYPPIAPQTNQNPWMRNNQTQYQPQQPTYGQGSYNQSRPGWGTQQPTYNQGSYNQSRPSWGYQPSNSSYRPAQIPSGPATNSHIYPALPNNSNNRPVIPSNSWSPSANQTLIYPQLPNKNLPVQPNVGINGIPLAPLQPQNPQGPHNWHSGGQAALSYGPGHYSQPAGNPKNNPPIRQGSSNPYANIFN